MMHHLVAVLALLLCVAPVVRSACGTENTSIPQLRLSIADISNAGTNHVIYGRVLYGSSKVGSGQWSEWTLMTHPGCNNYYRGDSDFFDQWADITKQWLVVALYQCGTNPVAIDSVGVWDGAASLSLDHFCPMVAGPSRTCGENPTNATGSCNKAFGDDYPYDIFWLSQQGKGRCNAMTFTTFELSANDVPVAEPFDLSDPGIPPCSVNSSIGAENVAFAAAQWVSTKGHNDTAAVLSLVAMISAASAYAAYRCKQSGYKAIPGGEAANLL